MEILSDTKTNQKQDLEFTMSLGSWIKTIHISLKKKIDYSFVKKTILDR